MVKWAQFKLRFGGNLRGGYVYQKKHGLPRQYRVDCIRISNVGRASEQPQEVLQRVLGTISSILGVPAGDCVDVAEANVNALRSKNFTFFGQVYGKENAQKVVKSINDRTGRTCSATQQVMVASGEGDLRFCTMCRGYGHMKDGCRVPTIQIDWFDPVSPQLRVVMKELTGASEVWNGTNPDEGLAPKTWITLVFNSLQDVWQSAMPTLIPLYGKSFLACAPVVSVGIPPTCHACGATEHNGGFHETHSNQCPVTGPRRQEPGIAFVVHQHFPTTRQAPPAVSSLGQHMAAIGESQAVKPRPAP